MVFMTVITFDDNLTDLVMYSETKFHQVMNIYLKEL